MSQNQIMARIATQISLLWSLIVKMVIILGLEYDNPSRKKNEYITFLLEVGIFKLHSEQIVIGQAISKTYFWELDELL